MNKPQFLDRAGDYRTNAEWLFESITNNSDTKFLLVKNLGSLSEEKDGKRYFSPLLYKDVEPMLKKLLEQDLNNIKTKWPADLLFMGVEKENTKVAWYAININDLPEDMYNSFIDEKRTFSENRFELYNFNAAQSSTIRHLRSMFSWLDRYRHCATCGAIMTTHEAGYKRTCTDKDCRSNKGIHNTCYPRSDPTAIMCIASKDGKRLLLGRRATYPQKMYSCLAGFIEPGESIEDAVIRETMEESGVELESIKYMMSQPYPFPSSLMIGCYAVAKTETIVPCEEMEEVKWFDRTEVLKALKKESDNLILPNPQAIACQIIEVLFENELKA